MSARAGEDPQPRPCSEAHRPRLPLTWWGLGIRFLIAVATLLSLTIVSPLLVTPIILVFEPSENALYILQFLRYAAVLAGTVGLVAMWMRLIERGRLRDAGWVVNLRSAGWLAVGVGVSLAVFGVLYAVDAVTPAVVFEINDEYAAALSSTPLWAVLLIWIGMAFLLQGIPEELLWRGWLFNIVRDRPWLAFGWTTVTFTAIHLLSEGGQEQWYEYVTYLLIPLGFGSLAGALVLVTGTMWIAAGVHAGFHVGNYTVLLLVGEAIAGSSAAHVIVGAAFLIPTALVLLRWSRGRNSSRTM